MKIFVEQHRLEQKLSVAELSRRSEVARSNIRYIEDGEISPTIETMCKLSKALNVPLCKLISCD